MTRKTIRSKQATDTHKNIPLSETNSGITIHHQYPHFLEWLFTQGTVISSQPIAVAFSLMLLPIVYFAYYPTPTLDYDVWFHLAYGRHYVENLTFDINHAQFSWTQANPDWKYGTWIGSTILYLFYWLAGLKGLFFLQLASFGGTFYIFYRYLKSLQIKTGILQAFFFLLIVVSFKLTALYIKPEMFSTLFFSATVGIYYHGTLERDKNFFWFYPILFCLWVNTHGGFVIGLFFVSVALGLEIALFLFLKKHSMQPAVIKTFIVATGISYLSVLVNPQGIQYPLTIVKGLIYITPEIRNHYATVIAYQNLWQHLQFWMQSFNFVFPAWILLFMAISYIALTFYAWFWKQYVHYPSFILNLIFFYLSMKMARAVMFYPVIWFYSFSYVLWKTATPRANERLSVFAMPVHILLCVAFIYIGLCYEPVRGRLWFGFEDYIPVDETAYIMKHKLPGPIFNDYIVGSYMMWAMYPEYKVFIDSRWGPYQGYDSQKDWDGIGNNMTPEGAMRYMKKYNFKVALINYFYSNICLWLLQSQEWRVAYFGKVAAVLVHTSVIPMLSEEALDTNVSPSRFSDLHEPIILANLFNFYNAISPQFGLEIRELFRRNVSEFYILKHSQLESMDKGIRSRELQLGMPAK